MRSPGVAVVLYGKAGCHLCDEVETLVEEVAAELGLTLSVVDITTDVELYRTYRHEIPVVTADGNEIGRGRLDEHEWLARLRACTAR